MESLSFDEFVVQIQEAKTLEEFESLAQKLNGNIYGPAVNKLQALLVGQILTFIMKADEIVRLVRNFGTYSGAHLLIMAYIEKFGIHTKEAATKLLDSIGVFDFGGIQAIHMILKASKSIGHHMALKDVIRKKFSRNPPEINSQIKESFRLGCEVCPEKSDCPLYIVSQELEVPDACSLNGPEDLWMKHSAMMADIPQKTNLRDIDQLEKTLKFLHGKGQLHTFVIEGMRFDRFLDYKRDELLPGTIQVLEKYKQLLQPN